MKGLLDIPALAIGADHVTLHASDGKYSACLTLQQAREYGVLVYELDGASLPDAKGGPFRLVTPGLGDLCANVKGVGENRGDHRNGSRHEANELLAGC